MKYCPHCQLQGGPQYIDESPEYLRFKCGGCRTMIYQQKLVKDGDLSSYEAGHELIKSAGKSQDVRKAEVQATLAVAHFLAALVDTLKESAAQEQQAAIARAHIQEIAAAVSEDTPQTLGQPDDGDADKEPAKDSSALIS